MINQIRNPAPRLATLILALLAIGFAGTALAQYPIGTLDTTYYDPDRNNRAVPVDLYYPAEYPGQGQLPADPPPGGFPAIACGHGYLLSAGLYAWVANDLAASGFVVAVARTGGELFPSHPTFALDLAFLTRALQAAGDDPESPFFGRMRNRSAVIGHSMGGGCSFLAAAGDPLITAVAGFAPAETNPSAIAACGQISRPVLIFAGTNDCVTPPASHQIPMYEALAGGWRTLLTITGASHCQWAAPSTICSLGEPCSADISRAQQQTTTLDFLRLWLTAVLFDDAASAQSFQQLLASTPGVAYQQAGLETAAPPAGGRAQGLVLRPGSANPFQGRLSLSLEAARSGPVIVEIFDTAGRRVRSLRTEALADRAASLSWDGRDQYGRKAPAGIYLVRARDAAQETWLRATLLR
jgi:predicted dienelactone hydrolase